MMQPAPHFAHATLPMALVALDSRANACLYIFTSTVAHYAVTPLIFTPHEYGIKVVLLPASTN